MELELVSVRGEQCHAGFLGSNGQLFSICPAHQRRAELVCPHLGLHDTGSRGQQREIVGVGRRVKVVDGAVRHKVVKGADQRLNFYLFFVYRSASTDDRVFDCQT